MSEHGTGSEPSHGGMTRRTFLGAVGAAALAVAQSRTGAFAAVTTGGSSTTSGHPSQLLADGWTLQSSDAVNETGDRFSRADYQPARWYPVTVPCTVLAGLVANGEYPDLFYSDNLKKVPV